jgi:hypothetical protein
MATEHTIGTHQLVIDGDTVLVRWIGMPFMEDMVRAHEHFDRVLATHGRLFIVNDMRRSGIPSAPTRQYVASWVAKNPVSGIANFGASTAVRILHLLLVRATGILGNKPAAPSLYFDSEAEALAWVATRRR